MEKTDLGLGSLFDKIYTKFFLRDFSYIVSGFIISYFPLRDVGLYTGEVSVWLMIVLAIAWLVFAFTLQEILVLVGVIRMQAWRFWAFRKNSYLKQEVEALTPNFWPDKNDESLSAAMKADTLKANFERVIQLKSFSASVVATIFFVYPCVMLHAHELIERLGTTGFWAGIVTLAATFSGAMWANSRKADIQFVLLEKMGGTSSVAKDPHAIFFGVVAFSIVCVWFALWTWAGFEFGGLLTPFGTA